VIAVDHLTKLEPVLSFFKRGHSQMALVTKVHIEVGKDPTLKKIGIVTLEDIIEDLL